MGVALPQPIQFGKYTLFERIGRGGMADVYKGRVQGPAGFERVFVVKRILPHLSDDPTFTKMFVDEAKLSARLSHPNIVQVFELGNVEAEFFISMEYVRGRDLAETMRTLWARVGPPRPELVAYIGREMCRALAYAHDLTGEDGTPLGMIHRDVSPSNVMLSYEGAVKLLDFGIAKALNGDQDDGGTQRGTLKGKFAYMAPEQTQGADVDRRIDIFATGIVLHEILTGRRLFKGDNDLQTVEKVRQCDVPPPSLQNPLCPPELDAIVLKALAKNREDRFQSAADMADALDDVVHVARFQPSHLAQLMRDLFPAEAGGGDKGSPSGSVRISQSMTGSASSRPYSAPMRSPTIPPVSRSTNSSVRPLQLQDSGSAPVAPSLAAAKPLWKRGSVWGALALVLAAFVGGALWKGNDNRGPVAQSGPAAPSSLPFVVQSLPEGAEVYILGESKPLGRTPFRRRFEIREDRPTILVFKLAGYEDVTREVKPAWSGIVQMRPLPPKSTREAQPSPDKDPRRQEPTTPSTTTPTEPEPVVPPPAEMAPGTPEPVAPGTTAARPDPNQARPPGRPTDRDRRKPTSSPTQKKASPKATELVSPF